VGSVDSNVVFSGTERFVLEREIGEGGMGVVYEATDRRTDVRVALKTLKSLDAQALARLKTEFRALQEIQHPNLVSLGELIEADGHWFFTMELVDGVPLLEYVTPRRDERRLRRAFGQLAAALSAIHAAGLIHRDVKPSNALVTAEGRVVLLDFGLVTDVLGRYESMHDNIVGTAAYMAPEQAAGHPVTAAADWYAFGVSLYEALTGELPYNGSSLQILLDKQQKPAAPPSQLVPGVPADLDELCGALLAFEPTARPSSADVLRVFDVNDIANRHPSTSSNAAADLIGRDAELQSLRAAYRAVADEGAQMVLLRGTSGLGKSALIGGFLSELRASETAPVILSGRCYRNESVPFKALDGVVDALANEMLRMRKDHAAELVPRHAALLPQLFPTLGRVEVIARATPSRRDVGDPLEQRTRAFGALRELFVRLAERRPLVVHIDDLHWSDEDSMRLLEELLGPPDAAPLLLLATAREGFEPAGLPCKVTTIDLGPLDEEAACQLAARILGILGARERVPPRAIAKEARGHPLHIEELARHVADTGATDESPKLDDAIWARIGRLSADARRLVELVAIAASPLAEEVLLMAAELPAQEFSRCVSVLRVSHLIRSAGNPRRVMLQHYHDRVRESITARLSDREQREHHHRLAIALELVGDPDLERLGAHLRAAGERERAADALRRAGDLAASKTAFARAARLYGETLQLLDPDHPSRFEIHAALGTALAHAGRGPEAAKAIRDALPGYRGREQLELQRKIAEQLLRSGHSDEGIAAIAELARAGDMEIAPSPRNAVWRFVRLRARINLRGYKYVLRDEREVPASELARIDTAWALTEALSFSDFIQGALFHAIGALAALRAGEPRRLVRAFIGEAINLSVVGSRARRRYNRALANLDTLLAQIDDAELHAAGRAAIGLVALQEGRFADALEAARLAEEAYRAAGSANRFQLTGVQSVQIWALSMLGRVREATGRLPELLRDARDRGDLFTTTTLSVSTAYYIPLLADRPDAALAVVDDALSRWSKRSVQLQHVHAVHARVNIELYRGDGIAAFAAIEAAWPEIRASMLLRHELTSTRAWELRGRAALAAAHQGAGAPAIRVARQAERALRRVTTVGAAGLCGLQRAGLAYLAGDRSGAAAHLERALRELADMQQWRRSAQWALGHLRDDETAVEAAQREIAEEGASVPIRFLAMYLPWLRS
jgi:tRNA A-37 threonylcarbamoyl transferase component Bud32/tetratricopeptide (TPR) repeat protein